MAGLVDKAKQGIYRISEKGSELLANPGNIDSYLQEKLVEKEEKRNIVQSL